MADFEYPFTSAGTPTSFPISGTSVTGIDEAGTLTPKIIRVGPGVTILITTATTDAAMVTLLRAWLQRHDGFHEGAGGFPTQATLQVAPTETAVGAAD